MEKMTNVKALNTAIELMSNYNEYDEVVTRLNAIKASLEKRAESAKARPRSLTKTQKENLVIKEAIASALTTPMTVAEIAEAQKISSAKASALLSQLVKSGAVTRNEGKGKVKTTFAVVTIEA